VVDLSHPRYEEQIAVVNRTLHEINASDKPIILVFNKMDLYEKQTFDEWLDSSVKVEMIRELKARWENESQGQCVFISALEKRNIEELRTGILERVRSLYQVRYPYKTEYNY
jgi:GTP-binding protein HflX